MDVLLSVSHQSQAHRIVTYYDQRSSLRMFPCGDFASSVSARPAGA